jgi:hypothetical protein
MNMRSTTLIVLVTALLCIHSALAATVTIVSPPTGTNQVSIVLNTAGEAINAVGVQLSFNPNEFSIQSVSDGGSIIELWVQPPTFSNSAGTLDFSGVIPGGITTVRGLVLTVSLVPKQVTSTQGFSVVSAQALLNDGKGTPAALSIVNGPFDISAGSSSSSTLPDTTLPDSFLPRVARDPNLFGGKYFLVFSTTDQNSGIDHYEVLESGIGTWQTATSSYLLRDQTLSSNIYVRAVDEAGNVRTVELPAQNPKPASSGLDPILLAIFGVLLLAGAALAYRWKRK